MQQKLSDMTEIWVFLIFCIFAGNMIASLLLGELSIFSLLIGTFIFGVLDRFVLPLVPAIILRKIFRKRQYKFNEWGLFSACMFVYVVYVVTMARIFNAEHPAGTFRFGFMGIWAIHLWVRIINFGKEKRTGIENSDKATEIPDNDITSQVLSTQRIFGSKTHSYRYLDHGTNIECQELLDGQWVTTGFYTKSTKAIRPVEITKDTMILLSNLYWYFRKIEQK